MRRHRARNTAWQVPAAARPILAPERTALESGRSWAVSAARTSRNDLCGLPAPHPADEGTEARGRKATRSGHTLSQRPGVGLMTITTTIATPMPAAVGSTPAPGPGIRQRRLISPSRHPRGGGARCDRPHPADEKAGFQREVRSWGSSQIHLSSPLPSGSPSLRRPFDHQATSLRPLRRKQTLMVRGKLWKGSLLAGVGGSEPFLRPFQRALPYTLGHNPLGSFLVLFVTLVALGVVPLVPLTGLWPWLDKSLR